MNITTLSPMTRVSRRSSWASTGTGPRARSSSPGWSSTPSSPPWPVASPDLVKFLIVQTGNGPRAVTRIQEPACVAPSYSQPSPVSYSLVAGVTVGQLLYRGSHRVVAAVDVDEFARGSRPPVREQVHPDTALSEVAGEIT